MDTLRTHHFARLLFGLFAAILIGVGIGSPVAAGGWAVTTLDAVPAARPGQAVEVGFTIRQHGITPIDLDEGVAVVVDTGSGTQSFPAARAGAPGHYVATVVFPEAGTFTWAIEQGWFGPQELGSINIAAPDAGASDHRFPATLRYGLAAVAAALAAVAVADVLARRRRHHRQTPVAA
jgi:hypothetical protein